MLYSNMGKYCTVVQGTRLYLLSVSASGKLWLFCICRTFKVQCHKIFKNLNLPKSHYLWASRNTWMDVTGFAYCLVFAKIFDRKVQNSLVRLSGHCASVVKNYTDTVSAHSITLRTSCQCSLPTTPTPCTTMQTHVFHEYIREKEIIRWNVYPIRMGHRYSF